MTTDCSATISPANDDPCDAVPSPLAISGANTIAATTTVRNAPHLTTVVISWKRLLTRNPASCSAASAASVTIATALSWPASDGTSSAENSPMASDTYPSTAQ